ncbi:O-antigen polymerase [Undibacterium sp. RuRC25W]|uniref:O-antigen polymerase n=1 Tax=Undibacterium sp. RuRC25W TaxID=3413047 RepID=UPI003BF033BE
MMQKANNCLALIGILSFLIPVIYICNYLNKNEELNFFYANALILIGLFAICISYYEANTFLFSSGFWFCVTIIFYIVLKSIQLMLNDENLKELNRALWACVVFVFVYAFVFRLAKSIKYKVHNYDFDIAAKKAKFLFIVFLVFKSFSFYIVLKNLGSNVLDVSAETQNQGAAYIYRIPMVVNTIMICFMVTYFRSKTNKKYVFYTVAIFIAEALISSSRYSLIILAFWFMLLYHQYRRPIRIRTLFLSFIPLALLSVIFGYMRNIEIGSLDIFLKVANVLFEEPKLIIDLFLGRLDMLPQIEKGIDIYESGQIHTMYGLSYIYSFLHAIPRNLWDGKPLLTAALLTSITHPAEFNDGVNLYPSAIVESIFNFGWFGLLISSSMMAVLASIYDRLLMGKRLYYIVWSYLCLTFPMGLFNEGFHSNYVANTIYVTILFSILWSFMRLSRCVVRIRT